MFLVSLLLVMCGCFILYGASMLFMDIMGKLM